jgi:hypothetical protein
MQEHILNQIADHLAGLATSQFDYPLDEGLYVEKNVSHAFSSI